MDTRSAFVTAAVSQAVLESTIGLHELNTLRTEVERARMSAEDARSSNMKLQEAAKTASRAMSDTRQDLRDARRAMWGASLILQDGREEISDQRRTQSSSDVQALSRAYQQMSRAARVLFPNGHPDSDDDELM